MGSKAGIASAGIRYVFEPGSVCRPWGEDLHHGRWPTDRTRKAESPLLDRCQSDDEPGTNCRLRQFLSHSKLKRTVKAGRYEHADYVGAVRITTGERQVIPTQTEWKIKCTWRQKRFKEWQA